MTTSMESSAHSSTVSPVITGQVLVATDGRGEADAALRAGRLIAEEWGVALSVVSVVPTTVIVSPELQLPIMTETVAAARAAVVSRVREQLRRVLGSETVPLDIADGAPAPAIAQRARELKASLIVVGLGNHRMADRLFGTETALTLLHVSSTPILAVPPQFAALPRRAIAAVDFSPDAIAALRVAQLLFTPDTSLTAAYVVTPQLATAMGGTADRLHRTITDSFASMKRDLPLRDDVAVDTCILHGDPASRILTLASDTGADLIVTGSHGYGFFSRMVLGSVATGVIRGARCAVLAVPKAVARVASGQVGEVLHVPPRDWSLALDEFSGRNVGCYASLEIDDPELGAQTQDAGYPFAGATYDRHDARVEIMLGELGAGKRHATHSIGDVTSVDILRRPDGKDVMLRIAHGEGQTLLTLSR